MKRRLFKPAAPARYFTHVIVPVAENTPVLLEKAVIFIPLPVTAILPP